MIASFMQLRAATGGAMMFSNRRVASGALGAGLRAAPLGAPRTQPSQPPRHVATTAAAYEMELPARTFADYSVYKGKAAVSFKSILPTFQQQRFNAQNGTSYMGYLVDREGVLLLEFANVIPSQGPQSGYGNRSYDWGNKITFALKALELAQLSDFDVSGSSTGLEFFHDPNKGNPEANLAKVTKTLRFNVGADGSGYLLSVSQRVGTGQSANATVPISRAEFVVLKHLAAYLIPRMYGFDMLYEGAGAAPSNIRVSDN